MVYTAYGRRHNARVGYVTANGDSSFWSQALARRRLASIHYLRPTSDAVMSLWQSSSSARTLLRRGPCRLLSNSAPACTEKPIMNRYSRTITKPKSQGASQAMLYDTDGIGSDEDFDKAMVGVASVW